MLTSCVLFDDPLQNICKRLRALYLLYAVWAEINLFEAHKAIQLFLRMSFAASRKAGVMLEMTSRAQLITAVSNLPISDEKKETFYVFIGTQTEDQCATILLLPDLQNRVTRYSPPSAQTAPEGLYGALRASQALARIAAAQSVVLAASCDSKISGFANIRLN
ncbi:hypothetical protein PROFUN_12046 [Planoprotostelium fungivorum]|uniref:Uncharacterized protein n=1 Tax=Planoprotostelium fungivorum TaxID=1890364 RepID=A0A2P6MXK5_9EUKA|nr:hypothetical protein PROFUN_12046 [Planoprotostelium fungivorum]